MLISIKKIFVKLRNSLDLAKSKTLLNLNSSLRSAKFSGYCCSRVTAHFHEFLIWCEANVILRVLRRTTFAHSGHFLFFRYCPIWCRIRNRQFFFENRVTLFMRFILNPINALLIFLFRMFCIGYSSSSVLWNQNYATR